MHKKHLLPVFFILLLSCKKTEDTTTPKAVPNCYVTSVRDEFKDITANINYDKQGKISGIIRRQGTFQLEKDTVIYSGNKIIVNATPYNYSEYVKSTWTLNGTSQVTNLSTYDIYSKRSSDYSFEYNDDGYLIKFISGVFQYDVTYDAGNPIKITSKRTDFNNTPEISYEMEYYADKLNLEQPNFQKSPILFNFLDEGNFGFFSGDIWFIYNLGKKSKNLIKTLKRYNSGGFLGSTFNFTFEVDGDKLKRRLMTGSASDNSTFTYKCE
ncbi:DUF4595 domain-containing protein [Arcicella sp. LKC2W]|uniref:DUF4595 domain-containing protein n=1 Tax=Arcicella sp. LKC2W TaxID=2984198 RepID=UPI002B1EEF3E|nr:DUF4595 domain-containing protein [Arcicella sp. LKC2W]MEA5458571.1 DUF4595 domain-containing protein [Arcicella sp. LKC2W]